MRRGWSLPVGCSLAALIAGWVAWGTYGLYGVGWTDQAVVIESPKPVAKVWYANEAFDDLAAPLLVASPDPTRFGARGPVAPEGNRLTARLWFTTGPALWNGPRYQPDLTILAEFSDGSRGCESVKVPKHPGTEPLVVRFR